MTVAMMLGMFALGFAFSLTGREFLDFRLDHPELGLVAMAVAMSVPMVAWMRVRGHGWRRGTEISLAMFVPAAVLVGCYWLSAVPAEAMCPLACGLMIPAMAAAMLVRRGEYA